MRGNIRSVTESDCRTTAPQTPRRSRARRHSGIRTPAMMADRKVTIEATAEQLAGKYPRYLFLSRPFSGICSSATQGIPCGFDRSFSTGRRWPECPQRILAMQQKGQAHEHLCGQSGCERHRRPVARGLCRLRRGGICQDRSRRRYPRIAGIRFRHNAERGTSQDGRPGDERP